jgi:hypothetical protein
VICTGGLIRSICSPPSLLVMEMLAQARLVPADPVT